MLSTDYGYQSHVTVTQAASPAQEPKAEPQVKQELAALEQTATHVSGLAEQLAMRLSAVLRPEPPSAVLQAKDEPFVPVAQVVYEQVQRLRGTEATLRSLLARLEV